MGWFENLDVAYFILFLEDLGTCLIGVYMFWSTVNADSQGKTRFRLDNLKIEDTAQTVWS